MKIAFTLLCFSILLLTTVAIRPDLETTNSKWLLEPVTVKLVVHKNGQFEFNGRVHANNKLFRQVMKGVMSHLAAIRNTVVEHLVSLAFPATMDPCETSDLVRLGLNSSDFCRGKTKNEYVFLPFSHKHYFSITTKILYLEPRYEVSITYHKIPIEFGNEETTTTNAQEETTETSREDLNEPNQPATINPADNGTSLRETKTYIDLRD